MVDVVRKHWCKYYLVKKSVTSRYQPGQWIERCKCGRVVNVSIAKRENGKKVDIQMTKHWFDKDGLLERITGNGINGTPLEINTNNNLKLDDNGLPSENR